MALIAADGISRRIAELERELAAERELRLAAEVRAEGLRRAAQEFLRQAQYALDDKDDWSDDDTTAIEICVWTLRQLCAALAAPPADPLPGLRELLAELESQARSAQDRADLVNVEPDYYEQDSPGSVMRINASARGASELARRLRAILGPLAPPRPEGRS